MGHYQNTIIETTDEVAFPLGVSHSYNAEHKITLISTDDDGWEISMLAEICKTEDHFERIFDLFFDKLWKEDLESGDCIDLYSELGNYDTLFIVEKIALLKLKDFTIYNFVGEGLETKTLHITFVNRNVVR